MSKYKYILFFFVCSLYGQYINPETGWEFHQSSNQAFYIFEDLQIDGSSPIGDGWAPSGSSQSECVDNINTCDVLGAFINDICVGWVYANSDGQTTLPIMGVDNTNETTLLLTDDYCNDGDIPIIKIYDATYGTVLDITSGNIIPEWSLNDVTVIYDISFANNGIIYPELGWFFYQSANQAFYVFENIFIDDVAADSLDIIGAFKNDVCVGWMNVNTGGFTSVPVMGAIGGDPIYNDYMNPGEIPNFKIYDYSNQIIYNLNPSADLDTWLPNGYYIVDGNSYAEIEQPTQDIYLSSGWNMMSLNVNPLENILYNIIQPIHDELLLVLDETGAAIFPDITGTIWTDNIGSWQSTEGYLVKVSNDISLSIENEGILELPLSVPLNQGWNIISYPSQNQNDIEIILSSIINSENLQLVFNEAGNVYIPSYITGTDPVNSIVSFFGGEGYYVKVANNDELIIEGSDTIFENNDFVSNNNRDEHFIPVWSGNPFSPMTIIMDNALWDGLELQADDEIGVFDGEVCVGSYVVPENGFIANSNIEIVTSKDDGSDNGFTEGNIVSFRVWRNSIEVDIDTDINVFTDPSGNSINNTFVALSAPSVEIEVKPPSIPRNFNASGGNEQVILTWNRPLIGDYKIYNYPDPGSSNAVTFTITKNDQEYVENIDDTNILDIELSSNTLYDYEIISVSPVNVSSSQVDDALTYPTQPVVSFVSGVNEINLSWESDEGNDGLVDYQVNRQWIVGNQTYQQSITSLDDNVNDLSFLDIGLLNSTSYSYRIRAHNSSGYSSWTSYQEQTTNIPLGNVDIVTGVIDSTYQSVVPPDNIIELSWDDNAASDFYRVYEKNLLLDEVIVENYIDPSNDSYNLETSSTYQYVITAVNNNGDESLPSDLIEVTTLPEYVPNAPDSLFLSSRQNSIELNWNSVPGYGYPIGGGATSYNIYRFNINEFDLDNIDIDDIIGVSIGVNSTNYIDSNLDDNLYYCYAVSGVNSEDVEGEISEISCKSTQGQLAVSTPLNLNIIGGNQQIDLSWEASIGSPPIQYQIYRSGDGYLNEFVADILSTSFIDIGLANNENYSYYVVAWNELGPSDPSEQVFGVTTAQSHILSGKTPEDLIVTLDDNARASNYIEGYSQLIWDAKEYSELPFALVYTGNPYSPHTIIVQSLVFENPEIQISDGDVIAVFDDNQLCVGLGYWPLPGGQLTASKDDGSGNGFTDGSNAYFEIWDQSTGHIHTAIESSPLTLTGLGLDYIDLNIFEDHYVIYRNGQIIITDITSENYQDNEIEGEMDYEYAIATINSLGDWTLSNISESVVINTDSYTQNAPLITETEELVLDEDTSISINLQTSDADDDIITYFAQPSSPDMPLSCSVVDNILTINPAPNYNGEYSISVIAFDDSLYYENNTLSDTLGIDIIVNPINDPPILLNQLNDIEILQVEFEDSLAIDLSNIFIDVDNEIMNQDQLTYTFDVSNEGIIDGYFQEDSLFIIYQNTGALDLYITASDQSNESVSDTFNISIQEVLSNEESLLPSEFKLGKSYPNPFNPTTNFTVDLPQNSSITISVYDISGREVDQIFDGFLSRGSYLMHWNAMNFSSGIYFISMKLEEKKITQKITLIK